MSPGSQATAIKLTERQKATLGQITRCQTASQNLVRRANIIMILAEGMNNQQAAQRLTLHRETVSIWRERWLRCTPTLLVAEKEDVGVHEWQELIEMVLSDAPRIGTPATFTPEQIVQIVAVACEDPQLSGRPITHWTSRELADEVIERKIVTTISPRSVGRFLDEADLKPHLSRYWLNTEPNDDPETFGQEVKTVCDVYHQAPQLHQQGVSIVSTDEKTGIQALARKHPTKSMKPGLIERREFEYIRHGTQCLIVNFEVATGQIIAPTLGFTRTENDFVNHIQQTIATNPEGDWIFIVDQLNTHQSESLVNLVIRLCNLDVDEQSLGVKGKSGILKSMKTRKAFLENESHPIRFIYTPKHTSWLNQVEIWFSILARKLLKRASFTSVDDLRQRILNFIDYFNKTMAKPFKWTYKGKPLVV